jgi:hypothetical protein
VGGGPLDAIARVALPEVCLAVRLRAHASWLLLLLLLRLLLLIKRVYNLAPGGQEEAGSTQGAEGEWLSRRQKWSCERRWPSRAYWAGLTGGQG